MQVKVLRYNLAIFRTIGLWRPRSWPVSLKYILYNFYTCIVLDVIICTVLSEVIKLVTSTGSAEEMVQNATIMLTMIANAAKALNLVVMRGDIVKLLKFLENDPCAPQDDGEREIQKKYDKLIRFRTTAFVTLVEISVAEIAIISLFKDSPNKKLPYEGWFPFELAVGNNYWFAWLHQMLGHTFGATTCAAYDSLVPGFMLQLCANFEILNHRLGGIIQRVQQDAKQDKLKIDEEQQAAKKITEFSEFTNNIFGMVVFLQFSISTLVICVTVYALSQEKVGSPDFISLFIYLMCMLFELFLFCVAGNELTLQSENVGNSIYCNVNWYTVGDSVRKSLLLMMMRSLEVVKFTSGNITLSIDTYNSIVKLSYSIYNVLQ